MKKFDNLACARGLPLLILLLSSLPMSAHAKPPTARIPQAWKPALEHLQNYLDKFSPEAHSKGWSCLNLEHTLTRLDHRYRTLPLTTVLTTLHPFPTTTDLAEDFLEALERCSTRTKGLSVYPYITRYMLLMDVTHQDSHAFLIHYLNYFYPHSPKHIRTHKYLLQDLRRLPPHLKLSNSYALATHLIQGILNPRQLFKVQPHFSPVFYNLLESQIWKIHFEYEPSLKILEKVAPLWLTPKMDRKKLAKKFTPAEQRHLQNRHPGVLRSSGWLINRLEWLAKRIGTPDTQKRIQVLLKPYQQQTQTPLTEVDQRWREIRRLWNDHQTQAAILQTQHYLTWLQELPLRFHKHKKIKEALITATLALAQMHLELGQRKEAFYFFTQVQPLCDSSTDPCFLNFHRELALAYMLTHQFSNAYEAVSRITEHGDLDDYSKQEYYFWQWILARQLQKPFTYDFPYLTYYRDAFACLAPRTAFALPKPKSIDYAPLSRHDISKFFPRKETWFIHKALQKNEQSSAITHYLRLMTYQIMDRLAKGRSPKLNTPKLMTFVKTLQANDLVVESAGILYEYSKQTTRDQLPHAFYRHFFPQRFQPEVASIGKSLNLSPALLSAFIRRESIFDPQALSPAYALGLMQVLPETAKRVAAGNRLSYHPVADGVVGLFHTPSNIQIGAHYIKNLLKYFSGNLIYTLASYNAGEDRVDTWIKRFEDLQESPLLFIENIPFTETRFYVKWVLFHYLHYEWLYGNRQSAKETFCSYTKNPLAQVSAKVALKKK